MYVNDKGFLHNENGPAYVDDISTQYWLRGRLHRDDGPALMCNIADNIQLWWINGQQYFDNKSYQEAAGINDEDMNMIALKYGNVK